MNNFLWNLVAGFPKKMGSFQAEDISLAMENLKNNWNSFKSTTICQMKTKELKHFADRYFNSREIEFAKSKNPKPNFGIRIGREYDVEQIDKLGKKIVPFFKKEITKISKLIDFILK